MAHLLAAVVPRAPKPEATTAKAVPHGENPIGDLAKSIETEWRAAGKEIDQQAIFVEADKRYHAANKGI
jgi:hypothetical protein